jgi:hypothetical protein
MPLVGSGFDLTTKTGANGLFLYGFSRPIATVFLASHFD